MTNTGISIMNTACKKCVKAKAILKIHNYYSIYSDIYI